MAPSETMEGYHMRTIVGAGAALAAGGPLASADSGTEDCRCSTSIEEGDEWSSFGGNPGNGRYVPSEDGIDKPDTVAWEYDETGDVAVVDGTVYLRTSDDSSEIHALDAEHGALQWTNDEVPVDGTPAVAGDTVYVGGEQLTALDAGDGSVRWVQEFEVESHDGSITVSSPTVVYGRVYVVVDGTIYALDATDGTIDWRRATVDVDISRDYEEERDIRTLSFDTNPVPITNELVYAGTDGGEAVVALDAMTGDTRWTTVPIVPLVGPLTASETRVYGRDWAAPHIFRFDAETGTGDGGVGGAMQVGVSDEYSVSFDDRFVCVGSKGDDTEPSSGSGRWSESFRQSSLESGGSFAIVGDTLVLTVDRVQTTFESDPQCIAYDLEDGTEKWQISFGDELFVWDIQAVCNDTIYDLGGGQLRAIRSSTEDADDGRRDRTDAGSAGDDGVDGVDESVHDD